MMVYDDVPKMRAALARLGLCVDASDDAPAEAQDAGAASSEAGATPAPADAAVAWWEMEGKRLWVCGTCRFRFNYAAATSCDVCNSQRRVSVREALAKANAKARETWHPATPLSRLPPRGRGPAPCDPRHDGSSGAHCLQPFLTPRVVRVVCSRGRRSQARCSRRPRRRTIWRTLPRA